MRKLWMHLFIIFLAAFLTGCFLLSALPSGFASPEEAVRSAIWGSDSGPYLFRTLMVAPDRAFVAYSSTKNTPNEVNLGYAVARRDRGRWQTTLVTQSGSVGGEHPALASLVTVEDAPGQAVLFVVLIDPQIAGAEAYLPDGTSGTLIPFNGILITTFKLELPVCSLELRDKDGQTVATLDFAMGTDHLGESAPEVVEAIAAKCGKL